MANASIGDAIVATQVLVRVGDLRADPVTADTVGLVRLVHNTGGGARAEHITTCLLAFALVLHLQVWVALALGFQESALVTVCFAV